VFGIPVEVYAELGEEVGGAMSALKIRLPKPHVVLVCLSCRVEIVLEIWDRIHECEMCHIPMALGQVYVDVPGEVER